ncbi:DUF397 domain-containing protein [Streptomyces sp. NRRL F-5630]|uniref:DUF397 domain-containing protein n=1 Tax=Streptomyces sp. NRRL F-5630 TaxID=1463864 RepID=UPI003EBE106C
MNPLRWQKSSYSSNGGNCVECSADLLGSGLVPVRDSKLPHGPVLTVTPAAWAGLVHLAKRSATR